MSGKFIETGIRSLALASGIGALVAGCFTVNKLISILETDLILTTPEQLINALSPDLVQYTQASGALAIAMGALSLIVAMSIILRLGNFNLGTVEKVLLLLDIVVVFLCFAGFAAGGVLGAIGANNWTTDIINNIPANLQQFFDLIVQTRDSLAATAAVSLFASLLYGFLCFWMIFFAARHWNGRLEYKSYI